MTQVVRQKYKNAHLIFLAYDMTKDELFVNLERVWLEEIKEYAKENVKIYLVGTKSDQP